MSYTPDEISKIHLLAQDKDLKNVLLAFELIRGRGIIPALVTDVYWIYNRIIWAQETELENDIYLFFRTYWSQHTKLKKLIPLLEPSSSRQQSVALAVEQQAQTLNLDLTLLAKLLHQHFPSNRHPMNRFLFKYGTTAIRQEILPFLKKREHTGRSLLDLGGFGLQKLPPIILAEKQIQLLKIWGNQLKELPDFWESFQELEVLNIAENQLQVLPHSFSKLKKLQKLYAQDNSFRVPDVIHSIQQLPNIKYLSIAATNAPTTYTLLQNKSLKHFEVLVNHGKSYASEREKNLFLALFLKEDEALKKLTLVDLFQALSDANETIRKTAKERILNWCGGTFDGQLPKQASIAILGIVSFATRNKLNQITTKHIRFTTEINPFTTHILVGDYPENYTAVADRPFIFMTEEDL